jgi:hypothetical protein
MTPDLTLHKKRPAIALAGPEHALIDDPLIKTPRESLESKDNTLVREA